MNVINMNGETKIISTEDDFADLLAQYDITVEDAKGYLGCDEASLQRDFENKFNSQDCLVGDDYYQFIEGLEGILNELKGEVLDSLKADGRKKANQRAAIYKRLDTIIANFDYMIH